MYIYSLYIMNNNIYSVLSILSDLDSDNENDATFESSDNENNATLESSDDDSTPQNKTSTFYSDNDNIYQPKVRFNNTNNKLNWNKFPKTNIKIKKYNQKKILCQNFIFNGKCNYDTKCLYAHDILEQNIDPHRKKTLDLLLDNNDLSDIDLSQYNNKILLRELLTYTKMCDLCILKKCTGGYNCKYGCCIEKYLICYDDLCYNHCTDNNCKKIHLSKRNLKPIYNKISHIIYDNKNKLNNTNISIDNINSSNYLFKCLTDINNAFNDNNHQYKNKNFTFDESSDDEDCDHSIFVDKFKNIFIDD
jgi:hypothetical protein